MGIVSTGNNSTMRLPIGGFIGDHKWRGVPIAGVIQGSLPRRGVFELNFGGWVLAPFICYFQKHLVIFPWLLWEAVPEVYALIRLEWEGYLCSLWGPTHAEV